MLNSFRIKNFSIKSQLSLFMVVFIVPFVVMGIIAYSYSIQAMVNIMTENRLVVLEKTAQNVDQVLKNIISAANQIKYDDNVQKVLNGNYGPEIGKIQSKVNNNETLPYNAIYRNFMYSQLYAETQAHLAMGRLSSSIDGVESIYAVSIKQKLIAGVSVEGFLNLKNTSNYPWYQKMEKDKIQDFWVGARLNEDSNASSDYVVTYVTSIQGSQRINDIIGYILFTVKANSLGDFINTQEIDKDENIFLTDNNAIFYRSDMQYSKDESLKEYTDASNSKDTKGYYFTGVGNNQKLVTYVEIPRNSWRLVDIVPMSTISGKLSGLTKIIFIVVIICISISLILTLILYRAITRPLNEIVTRMKSIAYGDFSPQDYNIETRNEVEKVHNNFNWMAKRVAQLMEKNIQITTQKRDAELKALQSQINPHFLYNTLDAINWLAMLNKQDDISEMIKNLSRFFRYGLSDGKEIISIEDEIKHVEAFLEIEKFRYKNRFKVYFNLDKRLFKCRTLKFILQPLVENAFVHGFKDTKGEGIIRIQLSGIDNNIIFEVIDDGGGMEQDLIDKILNEKSEGYGVKNVDERIKLKYGVQYGITIYSQLGEGSNFTITIPKVEAPESGDGVKSIEGDIKNV